MPHIQYWNRLTRFIHSTQKHTYANQSCEAWVKSCWFRRSHRVILSLARSLSWLIYCRRWHVKLRRYAWDPLSLGCYISLSCKKKSTDTTAAVIVNRIKVKMTSFCMHKNLQFDSKFHDDDFFILYDNLAHISHIWVARHTESERERTRNKNEMKKKITKEEIEQQNLFLAIFSLFPSSCSPWCGVERSYHVLPRKDAKMYPSPTFKIPHIEFIISKSLHSERERRTLAEYDGFAVLLLRVWDERRELKMFWDAIAEEDRRPVFRDLRSHSIELEWCSFVVHYWIDGKVLSSFWQHIASSKFTFKLICENI